MSSAIATATESTRKKKHLAHSTHQQNVSVRKDSARDSMTFLYIICTARWWLNDVNVTSYEIPDSA